jgi:hypothetical protein
LEDIHWPLAAPQLSHGLKTSAGHTKTQLSQEDKINTTIAGRITRYIALPAVSAGIIAGAAIGLASVANASDVRPPDIVAIPQTTADPAANAYPGGWWDRHHPSLLNPSTAADIVAPFK